jgi:MFS superfamily sulfate permease-like transporter
MNEDIVPLSPTNNSSSGSSLLSHSHVNSPRAFNQSKNKRVDDLYNLDKFKDRTVWEELDLKNRLAKVCGRRRNRSDLKSQDFTRRDQALFLLRRHIPILSWLPAYNVKNYLVPDILAGVTVGIMNIPQGLSYAMLVTLNPIYGLYISFFPLLIYGLFGSSKHLAIGAIAIVSLLSGSVVDRVAREHPLPWPDFNITDSNTSDLVPLTSDGDYRVAIASTLALLVGIFQFLMGFSGLGFVSSYFSDTFISGYTCGSAVHVVVSQMKEIFGMKNVTRFDGTFKVPKVSFGLYFHFVAWKLILCFVFKSIYELFLRLPTSNWYNYGFSVLCILFLVGCKEFLNPRIKKKLKFEFPSELLLVSSKLSNIILN